MPTLLRLLFVMGVIAAGGYATLYGVANWVKPQPRTIVEVVSLPESVAGVRTGRSAVETLDHQAAALVHRRKHTAR